MSIIKKGKMEISIRILILMLVTISGVEFNFLLNSINNTTSLGESQNGQFTQLLTSDSWFLNGTRIYINDNNPNYNWSKTAAENDWCSGLGTENFPYVIENVTINANNSGSCIQISRSSKHFVIRNCTLYNSGIGSSDAGIYLDRTDYGKILHSNITSNNNGIYLYASDNNSVIRNNISSNTKNGIYLVGSRENVVFNNSLENNINNGVYFLYSSNDNNVTRNFIRYNNQNGILIDRDGGGNTYSNHISENIISFNNGRGINCISHWDMKYHNISYNIINNNGGDGIYMVEDADENYIIGNVINNNAGNGINIDLCNDNLIKANSINNNSYGIQLYRSHNGKILFNNFTENTYGIHISSSNNNLIANNTVKNCLVAFYNIRNYWSNYTGNKMNNCGILIMPYYDYDITIKVDPSNLVNGKPLFFYINESNLQSSNFTNAGQIILMSCKDSLITGLDLSKGTVGVLLTQCNNITISESNFSNNKIWGIYMGESNEIKITRNIITNINEDAPYLAVEGGIFLHSNSNNNTISENLISNNSNFGMMALTGYGNLIYLNNFTENLVNAYDEAGQHQWDNGSIGNYWDDYVGKDVDDNGIGDSPYNVYNSGQDNYPIWDDGNDIPTFNINLPLNGTLYGINPPGFDLSIYAGDLHTSWYSLNDGKNYTFTITIGTINQSAWEVCDDGIVKVVFFINDTGGIITRQEVEVIKDTISPIIHIDSPTSKQFCGIVAPLFSLTIEESNIEEKLYSFNLGDNITFTSETQFNQAEWDKIGNGTVLITFYVLDKAGNMNSSVVSVRKDVYMPEITIHSPIPDDIFGNTPPEFNISIVEMDLDSTWYKIEGIATEFPISELVSSIDQDTWDNLPQGEIAITFYAQDRAGNIGTQSVVVIKRIPSQSTISGYNLFFLIGVLSVISLIIRSIIKRK